VFDAVQFVPLLALLAVEASRKAARTPLTAGDVSGGC
jgi:hypothetical protein